MTQRPPPHLPPDYAAHDRRYLAIRQSGGSGWDSDESDTYREMLDLSIPLLPPVPATVNDHAAAPMHVLELGCGAGNFSMRLARHGYCVTGVDIAPTAIAWANERATAETADPTNTTTTIATPVDSALPRARFRVDNVLTLATCANATFDALVDGHCLHCIIGADRALCLAAAYRVLKPGGVLVVMTMCGDVIDPKMLTAFDPAHKLLVYGNRPNRYIGAPADIVAEVALAGFTISHSQVIARKDAQDMDNLVLRAVKPGQG